MNQNSLAPSQLSVKGGLTGSNEYIKQNEHPSTFQKHHRVRTGGGSVEKTRDIRKGDSWIDSTSQVPSLMATRNGRITFPWRWKLALFFVHRKKIRKTTGMVGSVYEHRLLFISYHTKRPQLLNCSTLFLAVQTQHHFKDRENGFCWGPSQNPAKNSGTKRD